MFAVSCCVQNTPFFQKFGHLFCLGRHNIEGGSKVKHLICLGKHNIEGGSKVKHLICLGKHNIEGGSKVKHFCCNLLSSVDRLWFQSSMVDVLWLNFFFFF